MKQRETQQVYFKVNNHKFYNLAAAEQYSRLIKNPISSKVWISVITEIKGIPCVIKSYTV